MNEYDEGNEERREERDGMLEIWAFKEFIRRWNWDFGVIFLVR